MRSNDLRVLIYCIRNFFDFKTLKDIIINPAPITKSKERCKALKLFLTKDF